jgi:hypothetical protein
MSAKTWNDQPDVVVDALKVCDLHLGRHGVEVRKTQADGPWFVTVGGLFGSQTFEGIDAISVLHLLGAVNENRKMKVLPFGIKLVPNA